MLDDEGVDRCGGGTGLRRPCVVGSSDRCDKELVVGIDKEPLFGSWEELTDDIEDFVPSDTPAVDSRFWAS